jgi:uridine phosphorylase
MPLESLPSPALFHLGYSLPGDLPKITSTFSAVKYVILCGSTSRARVIAIAYLSLPAPGAQPFKLATQVKLAPLENLCKTDRFSLYQPSPQLLVASHGIGLGSIDIVLHELTNLLRAASPGCPVDAFSFIRCGSSGGLSVPAGSLVVSTAVLNGAAEPVLRTIMLGKQVEHPAAVCPVLTARLFEFAQATAGPWKVFAGKTVCCDTFYTGQARLDGAFGASEYDAIKRRDFLERCRDEHGVANFEMESLCLGSFCARAGGIPCAVVCAVLVDRLGEGDVDAPTADRKMIEQWEERPVLLVTGFVHKMLHDTDFGKANGHDLKALD